VILCSDGGFGYIIFWIECGFVVCLDTSGDAVVVFIYNFGFTVGNKLGFAIGCFHV
jgi:hypothetical protein